ncbi:hypothetical protein H6G81_16285 [Scytonema hofmannii FACHB-248]|uniref:Uncharacterized protein n=1 Tax=Scytonema hofmannii FACHB-248 TaxID=1842502 RepID=A0ABR8GRK5_9CYAN|nr:hypothetical protein [[Scytonema hofmanni] UTEX B 1581]MBD2606041.1 hypothetical protein [Scytonema hofmannii FACHB-248]
MQAGRNAKSLTPLEFIPAELTSINGKSPGNPVVELATSNGTTPHATTGGTPLRVRHFDGTVQATAEWNHRNAVAHQSLRGNEEKRIVGLETVESQVDQTSGGIPTVRVGQSVIGLRCSENTN